MKQEKKYFKFGHILMTKTIETEIKKDNKYYNEILECLNRHINLDFGIIPEEDKKANLKDIENEEGRVLSRYKTSKGDIYINTSEELYDFKKEKPIFEIITMIMFTNEY